MTLNSSSPSTLHETGKRHHHHHRPWYKRLLARLLPRDVFRVQIALILIAIAILLGILTAYLSGYGGLP